MPPTLSTPPTPPPPENPRHVARIDRPPYDRGHRGLVPITVNPSHNEIVRIYEALIPLLLPAGYNKAHAKYNLWGIIPPADAYATKYGEAFTTLKRISAYSPILQDAIYQTQKLESI